MATNRLKLGRKSGLKRWSHTA